MKRLNRIIFGIGTAFIIFCSSGCGSKEEVFTETMMVDPPAAAPRFAAKMAASDEVATVYNDSYAAAFTEEAGINGFERKIIRNGSITLQVEKFSDAENSVNEFAKQFGGYVSNSFMMDYSCSLTIRIPSERFDEAMNAAGNLGEVKGRSINTQDVSEDFYDLKTRLETKKTMQKKLESYLASAKTIKDLLEIERQLNNVTSEIESMEGRLKRLSSQIDFATITIIFTLPSGHSEQGYEWPDFGEMFGEFGYDVVSIFMTVIMGFLYFVIAAIPVIIIIAFLFWLLFGRLGLLIKLYKWLKWK